MTREEYIDLNYDKHLYFWSNIPLVTAPFVILSLSLLDYIVTPSNFKSFLFYRIITSLCFLFIFFSNRKKINRKYQSTLMILAGIIVSIMIALMIKDFGGHQSVYFAGFILTIIYGIGIVPLTPKISLIAVFIVYSIYFLPIIIYDKITNKSFFVSSNTLILCCIFVLLILRFLSHIRLMKELGLQYDLDQQKEHLEELVQDRTKELSISEKKLRSLFEYATDGIMLLDGNGKILDLNQKTCDIYGFDKEALVGSNIELLEADKDKSLSKERMKRILKGESLLFETQHYRKDTSKVYMEITAKAIEVEGNILIQSFLRDVTGKKMLQEQLLQSQKMESIGALAGGIAHNFNNLLTTILGNAELLEEYEDLDDDSLKKRVNNIQNSAKKAGMLVSKLLSFARRDTFEIIPLNLNDIINETLLFEDVLGKKIHIKTDLKDTIPTVEGDRNQLEQVIMNLIVNARDAMPDGGLITITTNTTEVKKGVVDIPSYITPEQYVLLTVSDTGCGIPQEMVNRVFDPFFTTKERGKGTGLGLATVYGIINDHKGYVTVQSEVGKGTFFHIYLPVSGKPVHKSEKPEPVSIKGYETILVVDDEEDVLDYIKDILETHGYKVMPTNNPIFAIDIFKELSGEIHLVITDNIMPLMEGKELIKNLKAIKPDIKIVAVSGYSEDGIPKDKDTIDTFIKKPFEGSHLLSTVRSILDTRIKNLPLY